MLICLKKQHKFKQAETKERRWETAGLHLKIDCDPLNSLLCDFPQATQTLHPWPISLAFRVWG